LIRKHVKDIVIFKFLLSKLLYERKEKLSEEEIVLLFLSREKVVEKAAIDSEFHRRYGQLIFLTRHIFVNLEAFVVDQESIDRFRVQLEPFFTHGRAQLSPQIFYGGRLEYNVRMQAAQPRKTKPRNRIGVGYRDKGNAKDSALDGSPSWQEVATDEWFQTHHFSESREAKIEAYYDYLKVLRGSRWMLTSAERKRSLLVEGMRG
jgi:hypothetical protein